MSIQTFRLPMMFFVLLLGYGTIPLAQEDNLPESVNLALIDGKVSVRFYSDCNNADSIPPMFIDGQRQFENNSEYGAYYGMPNDGIYSAVDEQKLFDVEGGKGLFGFEFSDDNQLVAVDGDGVYRLEDGQKLFDIEGYGLFMPNSNYLIGTFNVYKLPDGQVTMTSEQVMNDTDNLRISRDGEFIGLSHDGVYRLSDGAKMFNIEGHIYGFSEDSAYVFVHNEGVYRLSDSQKIIPIVGDFDMFTDDETMFISWGDGVYRLPDGEKLFSFSTRAMFSPDGQFLAVNGEGLYRISDKELIFTFEGDVRYFMPDSSLVMVDRDAVYRVSDGQKMFDLQTTNPYPIYIPSPDGRFLVVENDGLYRLTDGQRLSKYYHQSSTYRFWEKKSKTVSSCAMIEPSQNPVNVRVRVISPTADLYHHPDTARTHRTYFPEIATTVPQDTELTAWGIYENIWYLVTFPQGLEFFWVKEESITSESGSISSLPTYTYPNR